MPELPEIVCRANEIRSTLVGRTIEHVNVIHPRCLNLDPELFAARVEGGTVRSVSSKGKWLLLDLSNGHLLLNLGMGGELLWIRPPAPLPKHRLAFSFDDRCSLAVNFWWFGYVHFVPTGRLLEHTMTARLGPNILDISEEDLFAILHGQRRHLKAALLDQAWLAGLGNYYVHDILFLARLHPLRKSNDLGSLEVQSLCHAIRHVLGNSLAKGGASYETNLFGQLGGYTSAEHLVAYREDKPCPVCRTAIVRIRTGGTHSFVCPQCQLLAA